MQSLNARITHSQSNQALASTSDLEGIQALSSMDIKSPKVLNLSHARVPLQFIAQGLKRVVAQNLLGEVRTLGLDHEQ
jgi:predicted GNAT family acetyltransferase